MASYGKLWQAREGFGKALTNHGKLWQAMANYGRKSRALSVRKQRRLWQGFDKLWQTMASYGKLWQENNELAPTQQHLSGSAI